MSDRFSDYGITVDESRGGEVDTLCPECSHTRKKKTDKCLSVNIAEGTWFCHHCSWNGGLKGRPEFAKTRSASKPTVYVKPEYRPGSRGALLPQEVVEWFASRCISEDTLDKEDIGYSSGWIKFPFKRNGEVVNIKSRKLLSKEFFQEKGAEKILYGMRDPEPEDIAAEEPLIWVEGEMDRLSLVEAGFKFVVSVPDGAPTPGAKQTQTKFDFLSNCESYINKFQQHIIAVDNDAPGAFLEGELARRLGIERCKRTVWPAGCKDANDTLNLWSAVLPGRWHL
jgi:twinkle protein